MGCCDSDEVDGLSELPEKRTIKTSTEQQAEVEAEVKEQEKEKDSILFTFPMEGSLENSVVKYQQMKGGDVTL